MSSLQRVLGIADEKVNSAHQAEHSATNKQRDSSSLGSSVQLQPEIENNIRSSSSYWTTPTPSFNYRHFVVSEQLRQEEQRYQSPNQPVNQSSS